MTAAKPWRMHPQAESELDRAAGRYDKQRAGLGADLLDEFDAAYAAVRRGPITGTAQPLGRHVIHRALLDRFPYAIVFAELEERFLVVAVAHVRRHPTYWRRRLGSAP